MGAWDDRFKYVSQGACPWVRKQKQGCFVWLGHATFDGVDNDLVESIGRADQKAGFLANVLSWCVLQTHCDENMRVLDLGVPGGVRFVELLECLGGRAGWTTERSPFGFFLRECPIVD